MLEWRINGLLAVHQIEVGVQGVVLVGLNGVGIPFLLCGLFLGLAPYLD